MKKYDIVIVSHEKDFNNIKFIVEHSDKNLDFESIHLILSDRREYQDLDLIKSLTSRPIYVHSESNVLKVDKSKIMHRPSWIYQMLLKMFQDVSECDNYLIIESDCVILKPLEFFSDDRVNFYLCRDQFHDQYFNFNRLLGFGREFNHSFISEFMMYDKKIIKDMLLRLGCDSVDDFLEIVYKNVNSNCYPADYELYGNYCVKYHSEKINIKRASFDFYGREARVYPYWMDFEIKNIIANCSNLDVVSFHTWL